jgi:NADH-quinone oxidoreductase subunit M
VILAGVLLKMGPTASSVSPCRCFPEAALRALPSHRAIAIIGIIYGALVAMVQQDVKKLVAYSSVSHLGLRDARAVRARTPPQVEGAILGMINHGISTGALFLLVGVIYERRHTRLISEYGGLTRVMPVYATVLHARDALVHIGPAAAQRIYRSRVPDPRRRLPGPYVWWGVLACERRVLGAIYMLWMLPARVFRRGHQREEQPGSPISRRARSRLHPADRDDLLDGCLLEAVRCERMEPSVRISSSRQMTIVRHAMESATHRMRLAEEMVSANDVRPPPRAQLMPLIC